MIPTAESNMAIPNPLLKSLTPTTWQVATGVRAPKAALKNPKMKLVVIIPALEFHIPLNTVLIPATANDNE